VSTRPLTPAPAARLSPYLPYAVALHLGLAAVWVFGAPARVSSASFAVLRWTGRLWPWHTTHPLFLWGLFSGVAGVLLAVGWATNCRRFRVAGYTWGALVLAFIGVAFAAVVTAPNGSTSAPVFIAGLVGAHVAAASREAPAHRTARRDDVAPW